VRWEDGVIQDIRALGVKKWRDVAVDREDWQDCRANDDDDDTEDRIGRE
jgi:hypothetical protein